MLGNVKNAVLVWLGMLMFAEHATPLQMNICSFSMFAEVVTPLQMTICSLLSVSALLDSVAYDLNQESSRLGL